MKKKEGFTLVEMLIVLVIVSVLSLLIIPNITDTKNKIDDEGAYALARVIEVQANLYRIEKGEEPTLELLKTSEFITDKQFKQAQTWGISLP